MRLPWYLRGIQVEQAKQLIQNGEPGAALELLKSIEKETKQELNSLSSRLNLREFIDGDDNEFDPQSAAKRIDDALDISEILLGKRQYALAMALLAAAHETFLKAAIAHLIPESNL